MNDELGKTMDPPQIIYTQTTGIDRITRADGKANSMQWNIYERVRRNEWTDLNWYIRVFPWLRKVGNVGNKWEEQNNFIKKGIYIQ